MKWVISNRQLIFLFTCVLFIVQTLAKHPEAVKNEFITHLQQQREARLSAGGASSILQSRAVIGLQEDDSLELVNSNTTITTTTTTITTKNWAGAVLSSPPLDRFNSISARWTVPTVSRPHSANGSGTWYSAQWVGIDGYSDCSTGLLQAGISSYVQVSSSGTVTTGATAWYEWFPNGSIDFYGFNVAPGDTVEFSVTAPSNSHGIVVVNNLSTGKSAYTAVDAPSSSSELCGLNAEWIVEDFTITGMVPLANFTSGYFQNCTATTTAGATFNLTGASLIDMVQNSTVMATAAVVNSTELEVDYNGVLLYQPKSHSPVVNRAISTCQLIFLCTCVLFIVHTSIGRTA